MGAPDPQKMQGQVLQWSQVGLSQCDCTPCRQVTADLSKEKLMEHLIHAIHKWFHNFYKVLNSPSVDINSPFLSCIKVAQIGCC